MFTWICPQCRREVPPAYTECPDCAARGRKGPEAAPADAPAPPPQPTPAPAAVSRPAAPGMPTWLLSIVFAIVFLALGLGAYWVVQRLRAGGQPAAPAATLENVNGKTAKGKPHPLQKFIEVTGVRLIQSAKKQTEARFLVVNHSAAEISEMSANVSIWGRTNKSEEEAVGAFAFSVKNLGPYESKEMTVPVNTKLKTYELPDWQNVASEVQITAP